jgi:type II secretory ATPase GspE/PulE/Tfp pilus assembly ATPase PilB-like protein
VRVICADCKEPTELNPQMAEELGLLGHHGITVYHGTGCKNCSQTGFRGRAGIFELLVVDDDIRQLILSKTSAHIIRDAARKKGMRTLREDGWDKVVSGVTTVEEILRVTLSDRG